VRPLAIAEFVASFGKAVEVCCGYYCEVAKILKDRGLLLCVCDKNKEVGEVFSGLGIEFFACDVENPGDRLLEVCRKADVVYSIRPPPELWKSIFSLAKLTGCVCVIRPMSCDFVERRHLRSHGGENFLVYEPD